MILCNANAMILGCMFFGSCFGCSGEMVCLILAVNEAYLVHLAMTSTFSHNIQSSRQQKK